MTYNFKQVEKLLKKNGWVLVRTTGSHYQFRKEGVSSSTTVPRHGGKSLSLNVIKSIEKQTGLSFRR